MNDQPYIGKKVNTKHIEEARIEKLDANEKLIAAFKFGRKNYLIVTEKRLLAWYRGLVERGLDSFTYNRMTSVVTRNSFIPGMAGISIVIDGNAKIYDQMEKKDLNIATEIIRRQMETVQSPQPSIIKSNEDPIKALELRYVTGEINEQEFEKMKAVLLGNQPVKSSVLCSSCGSEVKPGAKFCISCGTPLN